MISIRVWKGYHPTREAYTPVERCIGCSNEVRSRYLNQQVLDTIASIERKRGKLTEYDRRRLYMEFTPLWETSERLKSEILQEIKESRQSDPKVAMTTKHINKNTIARAPGNKAQEMIKCLSAIQNLIEAMFTPKEKKIPLYKIPQKVGNMQMVS